MKECGIQKPSVSPIVVDSMWVDLWPLATDKPALKLYAGSMNGGGGSSIGGLSRANIARHGGRGPGSATKNVTAGQPLPGAVVMGFTDGHVETARLEKLWDYYGIMFRRQNDPINKEN